MELTHNTCLIIGLVIRSVAAGEQRRNVLFMTRVCVCVWLGGGLGGSLSRCFVYVHSGSHVAGPVITRGSCLSAKAASCYVAKGG